MAAGLFILNVFPFQYKKKGFYVVYLKHITVAHLLNVQLRKLQPRTVFKKFLNFGLDIFLIRTFLQYSLIDSY